MKVPPAVTGSDVPRKEAKLFFIKGINAYAKLVALEPGVAVETFTFKAATGSEDGGGALYTGTSAPEKRNATGDAVIISSRCGAVNTGDQFWETRCNTVNTGKRLRVEGRDF